MLRLFFVCSELSGFAPWGVFFDIKPKKLTKKYKTRNKNKKTHKNENVNFKSNISVKAMTPGEYQRSYESNLLVSTKYFMVVSSMPALFILSRFSLSYIKKDLS